MSEDCICLVEESSDTFLIPSLLILLCCCIWVDLPFFAQQHACFCHCTSCCLRAQVIWLGFFLHRGCLLTQMMHTLTSLTSGVHGSTIHVRSVMLGSLAATFLGMVKWHFFCVLFQCLSAELTHNHFSKRACRTVCLCGLAFEWLDCGWIVDGLC